MYDKIDVINRIKAIDREIDDLFKNPTSASVKGLSSSYSGRFRELQGERAVWIRRLKEIENRERKASCMQGPGLEIF